MKVLTKIWHVFLMNKLVFILFKTFLFIEAPGQQLGCLSYKQQVLKIRVQLKSSPGGGGGGG